MTSLKRRLVLLTVGFAAVAAGVHGQVAAFDPAETCEGKANGAECWQQLDSHPGCYVWNNGLRAEQTVGWTGPCDGSLADGEGVLTRADPKGVSVYEGTLVGGRPHGRGSVTFGNGMVMEGAFGAGQRVGRWRVTLHGQVSEGIYVNDRRAGDWVVRQADGTVVKMPYVNGEFHGTVVRRYRDGRVFATPWVNGKKHGTEVWRDSDGNVIREVPWVNGEKHGTEVWRGRRGGAREVRWVNGKEQPNP